VGDHDRREPGRHVDRQEQRQQRRAEHDLGRGQRHEDEEVDGAAAAEAVAHERHRHEGAERGGDQRRDQGDLERGGERLREVRVGERVLPVLEREALPGEVEAALVRVEREQDDDEHRDEQVQQGQARPDREQPAADAVGRRPAAAAARRLEIALDDGGDVDRHQIAASVRLRAPSTRA
jgi:hypothetical protein